MDEPTQTNDTLTEAEENGIKAIIFLQAMANIKETREKALAGWRSLSSQEKFSTLKMYRFFSGKRK